MMASQRTLVPILCMHRSGSSMVTSLLQRLGMSLGPFDLVGATEHNKYGHFEAIPIHGLDRELQERLFGFTEDIPPTPPLLEQFCSSRAAWRLETRDIPPEYFDRGFKLIQELAASGHVSGFKDPRVPLLWPFWEKILRSLSSIRVVPFVILRSPHEVAMSIFSRSQGTFSYQAALDVTAVHFQRLQEILHSWRGDRIVVRYLDGFFEKDLQRAVGELGLVWDEGIFRQVYDPECKHHEPAVVSHPAQQWFDRLLRQGNAKPTGRFREVRLAPGQLKRVEADAARREEIFREKNAEALAQIGVHLQEKERLSEAIRQIQAEHQQEKTLHAQALEAIEEFHKQIGALQSAISQHQTATHEQQARIRALEEELEQQRLSGNTQQETLRAREELLTQLQRQNAQLTEELQAVKNSNDQLSQAIRQVREECAGHQARHDQVQETLREYQEKIEQQQWALHETHTAADECQLQLRSLRTQLERKTVQLAVQENEAALLKAQREELERASHKKEEEYLRVKEDLVLAETENERLQREAADREERIEEATISLCDEIASLQNEIRRLQGELAAREEKIEQAVLSYRDEIASLQSEVQRLQSELAEREEKIERAAIPYQGEIASLQSEVRRLQGELAEREEKIEQVLLRQKVVFDLSRGEIEQFSREMLSQEDEFLLVQSEMQRLKKEFSDRSENQEQALARSCSELAIMQGEVQRQHAAIVERDEKIRHLSSQADYWEQCVGQIHRSTSWRITQPLRNLSAAVRGSRSRFNLGWMRALIRATGWHTLRERIRLRVHHRRLARKLADSGLFDGAWYRSEYPDVAQSKMVPVRHYLAHGVREGRRPAPWFDASWYRSANPDVAASGMDPFLHYCLYGAKEGRSPNHAVQQTFSPDIPSGPVVFPSAPTPLVSIIVPVHNQWHYTLWCLRAVQRHSDGVSYEVIVADDASTDRTRRIGRYVKNAIVIRQEKTSLGFLRNCNRAALRARGKYLLFLNNDTLVQPDWLRAMVEVVESDEKVGMVGAKLVYPDGRLQEAGGIIWNDASGVNYGRLDVPSKPEYNYLRDPDYVSGAALLIRRSFWDEAGGFDPRYEPAYYEDADLAFQARDRGWRVAYQPRAVVIHFEGISHGTDLSKGVKKYQVVNQKKFVEKWQATLQKDHFAPRQDIFLARQRNGKHVLVVDVTVPRPDCDAGSVREDYLLKILIQLGYQVTFYPDNRAPLQPYLTQLQQQGIAVLCGPGSPSLEQFLKENGRHFQAAVVSRFDVAGRHLEMIRAHCPGATLIYDTVDLHFLREQRRAEVERDPALLKAVEQSKQQELALIRRADVTLVVSDFEAKLLAQETPEATVRIVSTIHEIYGCQQPFDRRRDLLFIGCFPHLPNADAMLWFLKDVFPLVRRRIPGIQIHVIGLKPPPELQALAASDVHVLGHVPDIAPYFNHCRLSVAPLRYGAGVKGKINLSMSYGLPVVATSVGCEGMHLTDGAEVLIADDAKSFADAVCRLYQDEPQWERLSRAGLENVRRHFSLEKARQTLREILEPGVSASLPAEDEPPAAIPLSSAAQSGNSHDIRVEETGSVLFPVKGNSDAGPSVGPARRLIAFYLPQYHPIPENDRWWGTGFTEWTNVAKARPLFEGHYQPHLPADLGFYDLRLPEIRQAQAQLAREHGIHGFCYYHYWFGGRRLLERPFNDVLASGKPDFPFCLCWANENWSRNWDGGNREILVPQVYSEADDRRHIEWLLRAFADPRYLRIDGRPVMLIYRAKLLPNVRQTLEVWRETAARRGFKGLYLCRVESFNNEHEDPVPQGFDAAVEFQPDWTCLGNMLNSSGPRSGQPGPEGPRFYDYPSTVERMLAKPQVSYKRFPCVLPSWDNSARQGREGLIIGNSSPERYERWLTEVLRRPPVGPADENLVFINAWNEWGEGNHLEPDARFGRAYLEATHRALQAADDSKTAAVRSPGVKAA